VKEAPGSNEPGASVLVPCKPYSGGAARINAASTPAAIASARTDNETGGGLSPSQFAEKVAISFSSTSKTSMRGHDKHQESMFSYISPEKRVPPGHPLRRVREMVDVAFQEMSAEFAQLYSRSGRLSIAPEKLLRALLLQCFYSVRSERMLMEQMQYNLLFRWFVGLGMDDEVWDVTVFTKNRERLLEGEIAGRFFDRVMEPAREAGLLSDEHFTVDGTLIVEMCPSRLPSQTGDQPLPLCTPVLLRTMTTRRHALRSLK